MIMKPIEENPKQCRAERTALTDAHLLSPRLPSSERRLTSKKERPNEIRLSVSQITLKIYACSASIQTAIQTQTDLDQGDHQKPC